MRRTQAARKAHRDPIFSLYRFKKVWRIPLPREIAVNYGATQQQVPHRAADNVQRQIQPLRFRSDKADQRQRLSCQKRFKTIRKIHNSSAYVLAHTVEFMARIACVDERIPKSFLIRWS